MHIKLWIGDVPGAQMHNKYMIIDDRLLLTGSANFSVSAVDKNQENIMITGNMEAIVFYSSNFEALWAQSR